MSFIHRVGLASAASVATVAAAALAMAPAAGAQARATASPHGQQSFIGHFHKISTIASTVPGNGDVNPYGVAVVGRSQGILHRGSVLVSNFNNKKNLQGTGTTIVQVSPGGSRTTFARISAKHLPGACPGGIGLTTALSILHGGWVVVGSLPTTDGTAATAKAGCLLVLDRWGHVRETLSGYGINGPWDMTAISGQAFRAAVRHERPQRDRGGERQSREPGHRAPADPGPASPARPAAAGGDGRSAPGSWSGPTPTPWSSGRPGWA